MSSYTAKITAALKKVAAILYSKLLQQECQSCIGTQIVTDVLPISQLTKVVAVLQLLLLNYQCYSCANIAVVVLKMLQIEATVLLILQVTNSTAHQYYGYISNITAEQPMLQLYCNCCSYTQSFK